MTEKSDDPTEYSITKEVDDMTKREMQNALASKAGARPSSNQLSKWALNSLHAYLTGEFPCEPAELHARDAPNCPELRRDLWDVVFTDDTEGDDADADDEDEDDDSPSDRFEQPFRKADLKHVMAAVRQTPDQRPKPEPR